MTEAQALKIIIEHLRGLFPKTCPNCQRTFPTLRDFYLNTTPLGSPVSYDLEVGEARPLLPVGTVSLSNCPCGTSLALTSEGMPVLRLWSLLLWVKGEPRRRGISLEEFLVHLRTEMRRQVIAGPERP